MVSLFFTLLPMIIFIAVSLIVPLVLVLNWRSRPVLSFASAIIIYLIPVICLLGLTGNQTGENFVYQNLIRAIIVFLFFGLPILTITQWKSRKNQKRKMRVKIDSAF